MAEFRLPATDHHVQALFLDTQFDLRAEGTQFARPGGVEYDKR